MAGIGPRMAFAPLLAASGTKAAVMPFVQGACRGAWRSAHHEIDASIPAPTQTLAELCGVDRRTVVRWSQNGLTLDTAEDACAALGLHPFLVWGDDWLFAAGCPLAKTVARCVDA